MLTLKVYSHADCRITFIIITYTKIFLFINKIIIYIYIYFFYKSVNP